MALILKVCKCVLQLVENLALTLVCIAHQLCKCVLQIELKQSAICGFDSKSVQMCFAIELFFESSLCFLRKIGSTGVYYAVRPRCGSTGVPFAELPLGGSTGGLFAELPFVGSTD